MRPYTRSARHSSESPHPLSSRPIGAKPRREIQPSATKPQDARALNHLPTTVPTRLPYQPAVGAQFIAPLAPASDDNRANLLTLYRLDPIGAKPRQEPVPSLSKGCPKGPDETFMPNDRGVGGSPSMVIDEGAQGAMNCAPTLGDAAVDEAIRERERLARWLRWARSLASAWRRWVETTGGATDFGG